MKITDTMRLTDSIKLAFQHLLPGFVLSRIMHSIARCRWFFLKNLLISTFIKIYQVDMSHARCESPLDYEHFNAFFTRELKPGSRPMPDSENCLVSPVDGYVSEAGLIEMDTLLQAKDRYYSLSSLLGDDAQLCGQFTSGSFATLYLSPRNYHRIHMPVTGKLLKMTYIPGSLFSVIQAMTRAVDNLFARNERVISYFATENGIMALIMVGAIFVGCMETTWQGIITPASPRKPRSWQYDDREIKLLRGEEMGRFNMGSTVILLLQENTMCWSETLIPEEPIQMGQVIGTFM